MPAPALFDEGGVTPFEQVAPENQSNQVGVLYVTNCLPSGLQSLEGHQGFYTDERDFVLRLGEATVQLGPDSMTWEELQQASLKGDSIPASLSGIEEFGVLWSSIPNPDLSYDPEFIPEASREPAEQFVKVLDQQMTGGKKQVFIYVHGFKTAIQSTFKVTAELRHFFGYEGAFVAYLWPSENELSAYNEDKDHAKFSVRSFRQFLEFVAEETQAEEINLIAHSAGSPIVVQTLRQMRLMSNQLDPSAMQEQSKVGRVVLAAPDMDLGEFINASMDGWYQVADYVNIYTSPVDKALEYSEEKWEDTRLGSVTEATTVERTALSRESLATIEVGNLDTGFLGHGYFKSNPEVSSDVLLAMKFGLTPEQRGLMRGQRKDNAAFWVFPEDYTLRIQQIGRDLYGAESNNPESPE